MSDPKFIRVQTKTRDGDVRDHLVNVADIMQIDTCPPSIKTGAACIITLRDSETPAFWVVQTMERVARAIGKEYITEV